MEITPCGAASACGTVVWASLDAQADARKGSGKELVGMQLFRDMSRAKDGTWRGRVFVPDMNRNFNGLAQRLDLERLRVKGCLVAGVLCKAQTWTRAPRG